MKTVATLNRQYLQVNVFKTILKHAAKKQDTKSITRVATLIGKPIFLTLALENTVGLQQNDQLKNKE